MFLFVLLLWFVVYITIAEIWELSHFHCAWFRKVLAYLLSVSAVKSSFWHQNKGFRRAAWTLVSELLMVMVTFVFVHLLFLYLNNCQLLLAFFTKHRILHVVLLWFSLPVTLYTSLAHGSLLPCSSPFCLPSSPCNTPGLFYFPSHCISLQSTSSHSVTACLAAPK